MFRLAFNEGQPYSRSVCGVSSPSYYNTALYTPTISSNQIAAVQTINSIKITTQQSFMARGQDTQSFQSR